MIFGKNNTIAFGHMFSGHANPAAVVKPFKLKCNCFLVNKAPILFFYIWIEGRMFFFYLKGGGVDREKLSNKMAIQIKRNLL